MSRFLHGTMRAMNSLGYERVRNHHLRLPQFFMDADGGAGAGAGTGGEGSGSAGAGDKGSEGDKGNEAKLPTTKAELDALLQSETDKRVTQAMETAKAKNAKELDKAVKDAVKKAQEQANMTAEEKEKALLEEARIANEAKERELNLKQLKLDASDMLLEQNLPVAFRDFVLPGAENKEDLQKNIKTFRGMWDAELAKAVDEKLKGKPPKGNPGGNNHGDTEGGWGERLAKQNAARNKNNNNQQGGGNPYFG